jgi:hypothetical protein
MPKHEGHATVASFDSQYWHCGASEEMAAPQFGQFRLCAFIALGRARALISLTSLTKSVNEYFGRMNEIRLRMNDIEAATSLRPPSSDHLKFLGKSVIYS